MTVRRNRVFWAEVVFAVVPAVALITPRLLRWSALFAYGLRMRVLEMLATTGKIDVPALARGAFFLSWSITALIGVIALVVAVLSGPERLRRHAIVRGLLAAALLGGLTALVQFVARPLGGLSPRRDPLVLLVLVGPVAASVHQMLRLMRPGRGSAGEPTEPEAGARAGLPHET